LIETAEAVEIRKVKMIVKYSRNAGFVLALVFVFILSACAVNTPAGDTKAPTNAPIEDVTVTIPETVLASESKRSRAVSAAPEVTSKGLGGETRAEAPEGERGQVAAPPIELYDQFGEYHSLENYKGKVVFLNFWATWCPPCRLEMPDIQAAYEKYGGNDEDVIILGVASPRTETNTLTQEKSEDEVKQFLTEGNYTYPTVMDLSGDVFKNYGIMSFPTTFMIDVEGNVFGYIPGMLTAENIDNLIERTKAEGGR
jgi:cytochrome c-type biogenesis protein